MKKATLLTVVIAGALVLGIILAGCGEETTTTEGTTTGGQTAAGHPLLTNEQLSDIAPGLGVLMVEIGHRNWVLYYAATGGNWDLAAYQAKELDEAMEVGETTRPNRKEGLEGFTKGALEEINAAITAKDSAMFMTAWTKEVDACNACHAATGFNYIKWSLPPTPPNDLQLTPVS